VRHGLLDQQHIDALGARVAKGGLDLIPIVTFPYSSTTRSGKLLDEAWIANLAPDEVVYFAGVAIGQHSFAGTVHPFPSDELGRIHDAPFRYAIPQVPEKVLRIAFITTDSRRALMVHPEIWGAEEPNSSVPVDDACYIPVIRLDVQFVNVG
jgi:hypothetical protein